MAISHSVSVQSDQEFRFILLEQELNCCSRVRSGIPQLGAEAFVRGRQATDAPAGAQASAARGLGPSCQRRGRRGGVQCRSQFAGHSYPRPPVAPRARAHQCGALRWHSG